MKKYFQKISIITFILCFSFMLNNHMVKAAESTSSTKLPEVEVLVNYSGLKASENAGDVVKNENILTRISDVLLKGDEMYTYDSATDNDLHGSKPGDTLYGDMGCIIKDSNGERVTSINVTGQVFINVSKETVAKNMYENYKPLFEFLGYDSAEVATVTKGMEDVVSSTWGIYLEQKYNFKINFSNDGTFAVEIPENVPDDYLIAFTEIENPVTGEMVKISEINRLFIAMGNVDESTDKDDEEEDDDEPEFEEDDEHRFYSVQSTLTNYTHIDPERNGTISSSIYDVSTGIPTSENVTYSLTADNALYAIQTRKTTIETGVKDITIKLNASYNQRHQSVTYNESGDKIEEVWYTKETLTKTVTQNYSYSMPVLYLYDVPVSNIYPVQSGMVQATNGSNSLSSGALSLTGSAINGPQFLSIEVKLPEVKDTERLNLGHFSSRSEAQKALDNNDGLAVENRIKTAVHAAVKYTGNVNYSYYGLNVSTTTNNGVKPVVAKTSNSSTQMIPSNYSNGTYNGGGSVTYMGINSFNVPSNNVVVHTPVVNNSYISNISKFINQKINKDKTKTYLMLDEQFTITIPNTGTHNSIKGYGTRTYNSLQGVTKSKTTWGKIKDVKLPFDAYLHYTKNGKEYKYFVKANTWLSESGAEKVVNLTGTSYTYTIPVWVTEKVYNIETRVIAENATDYTLIENGKNSLATNYVATKIIPVEIIGKIYDLRISSSNDPGWSQIYSWKNGTNYIAADEFPFGAQGQNKITQYKYAPKLGYSFVFDFKTKGKKSNNIDVSVQPEGFYFVSKDGKEVQEVDLYYNTTMKQNIKIDLNDNNVNLAVKLRDTLYKVPASEFTDSTRIYKSKYNYSLNVKIGTFAKMNLPESLRLCYNNFKEYADALYGSGSTIASIGKDAGTQDDVISSVGHWYAGYRLPASTKAVEKGKDINVAIKNGEILEQGYIVVKFDIKTKYKNSTGNYEYLQYMGPEAMNEAGENTGILITDWTQNNTQIITLPNGNQAKLPVGSVAIFDADLRSSNDAEIGGTH